MKELIIVGGGIAGLTAAFYAKKEKIDFILIEASSRLGGSIWTDTALAADFCLERGPNSFALGQTLQEMLTDLDLQCLETNAKAKNKLIYLHDSLIPANPANIFLKNNLLSGKSKLCLFQEPFQRSSPASADESIEEFFRRRFEPEFVDNLIFPLISGIYAGDPAQLSLKSVFPRMAEIEKQHGSLIGGFLSQVFQKKQKRKTYSFSNGLSSLIEGLIEFIGEENIKTNCPLQSIEEQENSSFELFTERGNLRASKVILAIPAFEAAKIYPSVLRGLQKIPYASLLTVSVWIERKRLNDKILSLIESSFGFLSAKNQMTNLLGVIFNSSLFPGRCPPDRIALTCFLGGISKPSLNESSDLEIEKIIENDLKRAFGLHDILALKSEIKAITRWRKAIPQYIIGHGDLILNIRSNLPKNLKLAGNYLEGVSIEDAAKSGKKAVFSSKYSSSI